MRQRRIFAQRRFQFLRFLSAQLNVGHRLHAIPFRTVHFNWLGATTSSAVAIEQCQFGWPRYGGALQSDAQRFNRSRWFLSL